MDLLHCTQQGMHKQYKLYSYNQGNDITFYFLSGKWIFDEDIAESKEIPFLKKTKRDWNQSRKT